MQHTLQAAQRSRLHPPTHTPRPPSHPPTSFLKPSMPTTHLPLHLGMVTRMGARLAAVPAVSAGSGGRERGRRGGGGGGGGAEGGVKANIAAAEIYVIDSAAGCTHLQPTAAGPPPAQPCNHAHPPCNRPPAAEAAASFASTSRHLTAPAEVVSKASCLPAWRSTSSSCPAS